jgi:hypothetical protein
MNVRVSRESLLGWQKAADDMGVSLTSLVDVIGRHMHDRDWFDQDPTATRAILADEARKLDAAGRKRRSLAEDQR